MAVLQALDIYRIARGAGFSPDQAVTMTAIALAESGGETGAHNPSGEDSRGLWQINVAAHEHLAGVDLYDPHENARAAFEVSRQGTDISPWTVTHLGRGAPYLDFRIEAETAAAIHGDRALGAWSGVDGYGDRTAAAGDGTAQTVAPAPAGAGGTTLPADGDWRDGGVLQDFLDAATRQAGDMYVFGAKVDPTDADPDTFDCSGLVSWAAAQVGVDLPHASWMQYVTLKEQGYAVPVEEAINIPGALLFSFPWEPDAGPVRPPGAHVAISLGDGQTIEAMNPSKGVLFAPATEQRFNFAVVIPGLSDGTSVADAIDPTLDSDGDGITDQLELRLGLDLFKIDSDGDGITDGYELMVTGTAPHTADVDMDEVPDAVELLRGTDAWAPEAGASPVVGLAAGPPSGAVDDGVGGPDDAPG